MGFASSCITTPESTQPTDASGGDASGLDVDSISERDVSSDQQSDLVKLDVGSDVRTDFPTTCSSAICELFVEEIEVLPTQSSVPIPSPSPNEIYLGTQSVATFSPNLGLENWTFSYDFSSPAVALTRVGGTGSVNVATARLLLNDEEVAVVKQPFEFSVNSNMVSIVENPDTLVLFSKTHATNLGTTPRLLVSYESGRLFRRNADHATNGWVQKVTALKGLFTVESFTETMMADGANAVFAYNFDPSQTSLFFSYTAESAGLIPTIENSYATCTIRADGAIECNRASNGTNLEFGFQVVHWSCIGRPKSRLVTRPW